MMFFKKATLSITTIGLIFTSTISIADYKSDIIHSCTAYQLGKDNSEINACKLYIDGFIDALIYTEEGVVKPASQINHGLNEKSDFEKRVYNTRIYSRLNNEQVHQFCIPHEQDRKEVASIVAKSIDTEKLDKKPLKEIIFNTLASNFTCHKSDKKKYKI